MPLECAIKAVLAIKHSDAVWSDNSYLQLTRKFLDLLFDSSTLSSKFFSSAGYDDHVMDILLSTAFQQVRHKPKIDCNYYYFHRLVYFLEALVCLDTHNFRVSLCIDWKDLSFVFVFHETFEDRISHFALFWGCAYQCNRS